MKSDFNFRVVRLIQGWGIGQVQVELVLFFGINEGREKGNSQLVVTGY